jgi:Protein of unknown function (DUF1524)/Excalibur calcium-binding domain
VKSAISAIPSVSAMTSSATPPNSSAHAATLGSALVALALLTVKGRSALTGYSRSAFGTAWYDANGNGCDTRDDVLRRDLSALHSSGCTVLSGTIVDPYTGATIRFRRGGAYVDELDIDHVVALGDAWQTGAVAWSFAKRVAFANDPTNLSAVDPSANRQKGDADAASWLPANKPYRCAYVARQVAVKAGYGLWVTAAEKAAMGNVLSTCPAQMLPGVVHLTVVGHPAGGTTPSPSHSATPIPAGGSSGLDPRFSTCKDAKASGYGPYIRGKDPEYAWYRDADSDGIDCE